MNFWFMICVELYDFNFYIKNAVYFRELLKCKRLRILRNFFFNLSQKGERNHASNIYYETLSNNSKMF